MRSSFVVLAPVASAAVVAPRQNYFSFGNFFSTGAVATNSFIRQATTTLVLPELNSPHTGNLGLWPGMGTKFTSGADGHLVQGLAISTVGQGSPCNFAASDVKWCVVASTYDGQQHDGKPYRANPGDRVTYDYKVNDATASIDQTVSVNGKVVSTLSTKSGTGAGWGTAMECQQAKCGTVPEHHYVNTTLVMNVADPNYSRTLSLGNSKGSLVTKDGGKTWTVADITIAKYTYT
ncbi:hypothetical protein BDZ85DRAFT_265744 [Elsinoe ampelina]|uniref:Concanavalin A-like lectin/glucanase domain-containing protein n=1 Tax=Elsinoe ampelina TaxID=302913 RepID=A0A6A6G798_9PEZI|nr:hypothetical protein BDZ85DRAFT_265744 [Elsinoe ampelina]